MCMAKTDLASILNAAISRQHSVWFVRLPIGLSALRSLSEAQSVAHPDERYFRTFPFFPLYLRRSDCEKN